MPRANRYYVPGYTWHLTHRCHKKEFLLKFDRDRERYFWWLLPRTGSDRDKAQSNTGYRFRMQAKDYSGNLSEYVYSNPIYTQQ